jgi:hypothetical protein
MSRLPQEMSQTRAFWVRFWSFAYRRNSTLGCCTTLHHPGATILCTTLHHSGATCYNEAAEAGFTSLPTAAPGRASRSSPSSRSSTAASPSTPPTAATPPSKKPPAAAPPPPKTSPSRSCPEKDDRGLSPRLNPSPARKWAPLALGWVPDFSSKPFHSSCELFPRSAHTLSGETSTTAMGGGLGSSRGTGKSALARIPRTPQNSTGARIATPLAIP